MYVLVHIVSSFWMSLVTMGLNIEGKVRPDALFGPGPGDSLCANIRCVNALSLFTLPILLWLVAFVLSRVISPTKSH